jgi:phage FluMu gp28-like protein
MADLTYFFGYQKRWLTDSARVKIWEKSRRIGATYVQSYEDVRDAVNRTVPSIWFTSADESAAREYIMYCEKWAKVFNAVAASEGEVVLDEKKGVKAHRIIVNGTPINALSSNPKAFRSKGGKVVWDEAAWHDDPRGMWAALRPCITWGYPLRILSTHNGVNSLYNQFILKIRKGKLSWALHTTTIYDAVNDGLADKILQRTLSRAERDAWIEEERSSVADDTVWAQEYCCEPQDEASAFLTYDMLHKVERPDILMPLDQCVGALFSGYDVARRKHLSVLWAIEQVGSIYITRQVTALRNTKFREQRETIEAALKIRSLRRLCIDCTGLGEQLAEELIEAHGSRCEAVRFTAPIKESLASRLYTVIEDCNFLIPESYEIREDLHSVKKVVTSSNNIRFDVAQSENKDSHADRFWAAALALHATDNGYVDPKVTSRGRRSYREYTDSYLSRHEMAELRD